MAEYNPVTAHDAIAPFGELSTDVENRKKAEEAGVATLAYVEYETALKNYEGRSDIETLEARRAREAGVKFEEGRVVREAKDDNVVDPEDAAKGAEKAEAFKRKQTAKTNEVSE